MSELSLVVHREIAAPAKSVYSAWLDADMLAKFMIPGEGMSVPVSKVDAREGGRFELIMAAGEQRIPHSGIYKVLKPYSQIVFTWESPHSTDGSTVTLNFSESNGKTQLELLHVKFPDEESCSNHKNGWTAILRNLESNLA